jgi:outer membrane protein assembly factor BamB
MSSTKKYSSLSRILAGAAAAAIMGGVVVVAATMNRPAADEAQAALSKGDPWPMWGGSPTRNMVNLREKSAPTKWDVDTKENVLWVQELGSKSYGGPAIGDGKIFISTNNQGPRATAKGDKGIILCFEEGTGKFLWQRIHNKLPSGNVQDWPLEGICSTPAVDGKKVYYVSNDCKLVCATTDSKDVWTLDMIKDLGVFPHNLSTSSPLIIGEMVYVVTSNGVNENHIDIPAPAAPSFIAVNKTNGNVIWKNNDPSKNLLTQKLGKDADENKAFIKALVNKGEVLMHGQWSSPAYVEVNGAGLVIFPGGDGWLRGMDAKTGEVIWKFDCNPKSSHYELGGKGNRNDFIATPVVYDNKVYIGVGQDPEHDEGIGHFWCIDVTKKGDVSPRQDNFDPKAAINKDSGLVFHYGEPSPKELRKGRNYLFGRTLSTAAIHEGLVYIAELAGWLHCLDAKTGQHYWMHDCDAPIWSSPYIVDGKVYLGTDNKQVLIFEHGKKKNLIESVEMDSKVRATPVMANGILYVMTENKLRAIGAKK